MFSELIALLQSHQGEISQEEICAKMDISPATLQNIVDILIRKGKIVIIENGISACQNAATCHTKGSACPGPQNCSLILLRPNQFTFKVSEQ